jgi:hypothetical protein
LASLAIPGAGALWSGKEISALLCGAALSIALAAVTCSLGGGRAGGPLVADLQNTVAACSALALALIWIAGAVGGIRSFTAMQQIHNIAGERG